MTKKITCPNCHGWGTLKNTVICGICHGYGKGCKTCKGKGHLKDTCPNCHGAGWYKLKDEIKTHRYGRKR